MSIDFEKCFRGLTGYEPFRWQIRLYRRLLKKDLPPALDLPTGLGKTSVMAIWLLARLCNSSLPRRLVYVVDRRAVVDQATREAEKLRNALAKIDVLSGIRGGLGLGDRLLPVSTLRGQFADNREWLSDPTAPAIVVGTIDMIGSRLLFEGYGVSRGMRSFHAGLLGSDTLVVLDEAHLCPPFEALLRSVASDNGLHPVETENCKIIPHFRLLPLSATGRTADEKAFRLEPEDHEDQLVKKRLKAEKRLNVEILKPDAELVDLLAERAWNMRGGNNRVLVYCDHRKDAEKVEKAVRDCAKQEMPAVVTNLLVGARRVREREKLAAWLQENGFLAGSNIKRKAPAFLIATSAGEVGIDLDADHMVCDLAPFERMVQRLGRVNRRGEGAALIEVIAIPPEPPRQEAKDEKKQEYQRERAVFEARVALLSELPTGEDNRRNGSPGAIVELKERASKDERLAGQIRFATSPDPLHPDLTRALLDAWSMTSLEQHTGRPEIEPWLRGWVEDDKPQTVVAWRRFLPWRVNERPDSKDVKEFFDAAPVHLTETLEALTYEVVETLISRAVAGLKTSKPEVRDTEETLRLTPASPAILVLNRAGEMHRAFTVGELVGLADKSAKKEKQALFSALIGKQVIIAQALGGLSEVGLLDGGEGSAPETLDDGWTSEEIEAIGYRILRPDQAPAGDWRITYSFDLSRSEDDEDSLRIAVETLRRKDAPRQGDPAVSRRSQSLDEHHDWAGAAADQIAGALGLPDMYRHMLVVAARVHDAGKNRVIWQRAMNAPILGRPYAKTMGGGNGRLLDGYRHEFGSLGDVETDTEIQKLPDDLKDLALHLIVSHHGYARPVIAPIDPNVPPSLLAERAHETALRFARLQRRWGPWGLAWWEAVFRAADWRASSQLDAQPDSKDA